MRKFFHIVFILLLFGGLSILVIGLLMKFSEIGLDTNFYKFFNDDPLGWVILFGAILAGLIGTKLTRSKKHSTTQNTHNDSASYPEHQNSSSNSDEYNYNSNYNENGI